MENEEQNAPSTPQQSSQNKKKTVITIPSYQEVIASSQIKSTPPQNLFAPSQSFSQAFSFIKNSEFYDPPPVKPTNTQNLTSSEGGEVKGVVSSSSSSQPNLVSSSSSSKPNQNRNAILVSHRQKGNPLLKYIRNVRWAFADVICDYLIGQNSCALYLRFEVLHTLSSISFVLFLLVLLNS
ncbi:hypothetical protein Pint_19981 [Pistacia integerrima]|uniref:Uncharacterized protein n=1 Tax=Pistacia integerrima TaxID=434235 RepID=A0ACC0XEX2_9ROSI|nr:hypothetical protein Pint_19981 [Pistacia integerrima]